MSANESLHQASSSQAICSLVTSKSTRERTIRLAADTIRFDSMQKNIGRFDTESLALSDVTTTTAATAEENIDAETLSRQVP